MIGKRGVFGERGDPMSEVQEFAFEEWLAEGVRGVRSKLCRPLLPEEFRAHCRAAQKEMLLAVRSLFDAAIERLEQPPKNATRRRATKIKVE